ncbi:hypothetical protein ZIOFF_041922 [Zingiber officinale]|uniref:Neprosin PEP catalytic domain-containing protein n=1 Tax=Zingiber officinale TaxID=94328 RepID=A0A8J5G7C4_ZINOF|nr:hypothetical protein ZIOFF_041922 [Zingiber officinale]
MASMCLIYSSLLFSLLLCSIEGRNNIPLTVEEDLELENELQSLNKPPVKVLKSFTGDLFDCIQIYKQPAFDHPAMKNHKLQIRPSFQTKNDVNMDEKFKPVLDPGFNDTCPLGTVLIRRTRKEDLIIAKELPKYFRNYGSRYHVLDSSEQNYYAIAESQTGRYHGFESKITTWALPNVGPNQVSQNQVWMIGDVDADYDEQTVIQTGWHTDGYQTGCMNLNCKGFVQVSATHAPGYAFKGDNLSTYGGLQAYFDFRIQKDPQTGNWWLAMDRVNLGYWPKELFPNLDVSKLIQFGGQVRTPNDVPSPPMGNGHFPQEGAELVALTSSSPRQVLSAAKLRDALFAQHPLTAMLSVLSILAASLSVLSILAATLVASSHNEAFPRCGEFPSSPRRSSFCPSYRICAVSSSLDGEASQRS